MNSQKEQLKNDVVDFAERCKADPSRYSQATASVLFALAGALAAGQEELLMDHVADFSQRMITQIRATRN